LFMRPTQSRLGERSHPVGRTAHEILIDLNRGGHVSRWAPTVSISDGGMPQPRFGEAWLPCFLPHPLSLPPLPTPPNLLRQATPNGSRPSHTAYTSHNAGSYQQCQLYTLYNDDRRLLVPILRRLVYKTQYFVNYRLTQLYAS